ncbi:MAG: hypothetical protein DRI30_04505 [Chloroflexi bacterium]|nr:MAG: hypothetical protein DRI30_04505 [Chloroflexota bacterium]
MELDGPLARVMLLVAGAMSAYASLGLLIHVVLADAIPNPPTRNNLHTVLLTVAFGGLICIALWVM